MGPHIIFLRTVIRGLLSVFLITTLLISLRYLVNELNTPDPSAPMVALLGNLTGALSTALGVLVNAIASNPSDRGPTED